MSDHAASGVLLDELAGLRVLAQRGTSQLKMRDFSHECISYRNFHEEGHRNSAE